MLRNEKLETPVAERRSTAETELGLPTESLAKIIEIIFLIKQFDRYYRDGYIQI